MLPEHIPSLSGEERARSFASQWIRKHLPELDFVESNIVPTSTYFQDIYLIRMIVSTPEGILQIVEMQVDIQKSEIVGKIVRAPMITTVLSGPTDEDE